MASLNKVLLIGLLGRDPEVRFMPNGDAVANFSIATAESWKGKDGSNQEKTEWHNIVMYRKLAEIAGKYLKKGRPVYIEGRLQTRKWEKDGVTRYSTEIIADSMQMLGDRSENNDSYNTNTQEKEKNEPKNDYSSNEFNDDIPFMNPYKFNWRVI